MGLVIRLFKRLLFLAVLFTPTYTNQIRTGNERQKRGVVAASIVIGCSTFVAIQDCSNFIDECPSSVCDPITVFCSAADMVIPLEEVCKKENIEAAIKLINQHVIGPVIKSAEDVERAMNGLGDDVKNQMDDVKKAFESAWNKVTDFTKTAANAVKKAFDSIGDFFTGSANFNVVSIWMMTVLVMAIVFILEN